MSPQYSLCQNVREPRTDSQRKIQELERDTASDDDMFIGTVKVKEKDMHVDKVDVRTDRDVWKETVKIDNQPLTVMIDTGADCNVISKGESEKLKLSDNKLPKSCYKWVGLLGQKEKPPGQETIKYQHKEDSMS